jgi:cell wall-associated NlpC family hydrolase
MNKKLLSSCLTLTLCATALIPVNKQLGPETSTSIHPITEYRQLSSEKVSSLKQLIQDGEYTVTYSQDEENKVILTPEEISVKTAPVKSSIPATNKNTTLSSNKPSAKTSNTSTAAKPKTTSTRTSTATKTKAVSNTATASKTSTRTSTTTSSRGTVSQTSSRASAVISTAKNYMGVPYVWGGTTPDGFDCSGFTQYVFGKNGISLPRTAAEQYQVGTSLSKSSLRAGDLVFFTTYKAGASHLGIYLGDGNFIHASSSKGVTISSLSNVYYSSHYIGARRIIY